MNITPKNRIVPWLSRKEFLHTYQLVFSDNLDEKRKGFEELLVWKSRIPILPLGAECTLNLLQAFLQENADASNFSSSSDFGMQLMYSICIIRFVNLVSHPGQVDRTHRSISDIAQQVGIPDWLVNMRHDATHAKLPSLEALKSGASVAMDWSEANYWLDEGENGADVFWPETRQGVVGKKIEPIDLETVSNHKQLLCDTVEIPEHILTAAKMLILLLKEMPGRKTLHQVKNEAVKQYAHKLWTRSKTSSNIPSERKSVKLNQPLEIIMRLLVSELEQTVTQWVSTGEVPTSSTHSDDTTFKGQFLALVFYSCWELMVDLDLESYQQKSPWILIDRWNVFPFLMELLSLIDYEKENEYACSLSLISSLADHLLKQQREEQSFDFIPTIRNLLLKPHAETLQILLKLEELQGSSLRNLSAWNDLKKLLKIRLGLDAVNGAETLDRNQYQKCPHIFTLNMIKEANEMVAKQAEAFRIRAISIPSTADSASLGDVDTWTLCSSDCDWSRTPIGSLANSIVGPSALNLSHARWECLDRSNENDVSTKNNCHKKRKAVRFDWNSLVRKRRRRGGLKCANASAT